MTNKFDHRKFNITTADEAMDFIDLVVAKLPQIHKVLKKARFVTATAQNQIDYLQKQLNAAQNSQNGVAYDSDNLSVSERLSGLRPTVSQATAQASEDVLTKMRLAAEAELAAANTPVVEEEVTTVDDEEIEEITVGPLKPGAVGRVNVAPPVDPSIQTQTTVDTVVDDEVETEEDIDLDDLLGGDEEATTTTEPSDDDLETVGSKVAKAQKKANARGKQAS